MINQTTAVEEDLKSFPGVWSIGTRNLASILHHKSMLCVLLWRAKDKEEERNKIRRRGQEPGGHR